MKEGAADYLLKPIKMDEVEVLIEKTLAISRLQDENRDMKRELKSIYGMENIIGRHTAMRKVMDLIQQVADTKTTIFDSGRKRHRQRAGSPGDSFWERSRQPAFCGDQLRGDSRNSLGERTLRP